MLGPREGQGLDGGAANEVLERSAKVGRNGGNEAEVGQQDLHRGRKDDVGRVDAQFRAAGHPLHGDDLEVNREGVMRGVVRLVPVGVKASQERD